MAPAPNTIMSSRKCMSNAHPRLCVSITDFASNHPNMPDTITLNMPPLKKCGIPNITAEIQQIYRGGSFPDRPPTITNLLNISSVHAFVKENKSTNGKSFQKVSFIVPLFASTLNDINKEVPNANPIRTKGPKVFQFDVCSLPLSS